jgi:hypothetical protein
MKNRFGAVTITLIVLLTIRAIIQIAMIFIEKEAISKFIFIILALAYLIAILGVSLKRKFGAVMTMIIATFDLLSALLVGGTFGLGAGIMDLALVFLGYKEYTQIK